MLIFVFEAYAFWGISAEHPALPQSYPVHLFQAHAGMSARSSKSYREKKAKPLWEKIVKVLRSVYRAYFDLKSKFERLQSAYDREVSKNGSLSARIYEVCAERDGLKGQVRDYERVRRAIGPEQADRILEAAYQQEQVEKEQKWGARSKIRVGAR